MEDWAFIGLIVVAWFFIAPTLGIVGFLKAGRLQKELQTLKAHLAEGMADAPIETAPPPKGAPDNSSETIPLRPDGTPPPSRVFESDRASDTPSPPKSIATPGLGARPSGPNRDWERLIAANWIVWVGGLAVALGGLLLVRFVWEAGLLNELGRVGLAALFGLSLIALATRSEGWKSVQAGRGALKHLPTLLAAAGVTTLNGAVFASSALYQLVSPPLALAGFALVATFSVGLALRFGRFLAALGLVGAYAGPLLTGASGGSMNMLLAYAASITGVSLTLIRLRGWNTLVWISLAGSAFWGLAGLSPHDGDWAGPLYALTLGAMGLFFAEAAARRALDLDGFQLRGLIGYLRATSESLLAGYIFAALSGVLIFSTLAIGHEGASALMALLVYCGLSLLVAWRRPGLVFLSLISAAIAIASLLVWPTVGLPLEAATLTVALGFGLGGAALMRTMALKAPMAASSAMTPPAALFVPISGAFGVSSNFIWGLIALGFAVGLGIVLEQLRRPKRGFEGREGAAAAYGLGAVLCAGLAPFALLEGLWLGSALAIVALGICAIYRRFTLPVLAWCGPATIAIAIALLIRPWLLRQTEISTTPIFNELLFGYGLAIAALAGAAWLSAGSVRLRRAAQAGALILGFNLIGLEIRHLAQDGDLFAPGYGLGEVSAYTISYLGLAASLAWRLSAQWRGYLLLEYIALGIGGLAILLSFTRVMGEPAAGVAIFNLLLLGFAMPALLLAVYAEVLRRQDRERLASILGWTAMGLGFFWVTFEARRAWVGENLGVSTNGEGVWIYSLAWICYAVFLLGWGTLRARASARFASLAILLLAVGKVFLFDLSLLDGAVRAASFIGLGLALIAIAIFYQRFVFSRRLAV